MLDHTYRKRFFCSNCGKAGHDVKSCREAICSWGVINIDINYDSNDNLDNSDNSDNLDNLDNLDNQKQNIQNRCVAGSELCIIKEKFSTKKNTYLKIISKKYPDIKCYMSDNIRLSYDMDIYKLDIKSISYQDDKQIKKFFYYKDKILFMLVSRQFSLGFIEFLRGKYDVSNVKSIINLFEQMYDHEIAFIGTNHYDDILYYFLNRSNESQETVLNRIYEGKYSNEYCEAKIKFNLLKLPSDDHDVPLDLYFYTKNIKPKWKGPEWGFPKGRRDKRTEENISCACREFEEETGYNSNEYVILNKIEPIEERLVGTNGINYRHVYYLSANNRDGTKKIGDYDNYEIGEIRWFTYEEAIARIRPYHTEKKNILTRVYLFILNYLIHNDCAFYSN